MSAFLCSEDHLNYLVNAARTWNRNSGYVYFNSEKVTQENCQDVLDQLFLDNCLSLNARYSERSTYMGTDNDYEYSPLPTLPIEPVCVLKQIDCYEYQACEFNEWEQSKSYEFCQNLRKEAIRRLDGYDDAPWGL